MAAEYNSLAPQFSYRHINESGRGIKTRCFYQDIWYGPYSTDSFLPVPTGMSTQELLCGKSRSEFSQFGWCRFSLSRFAAGLEPVVLHDHSVEFRDTFHQRIEVAMRAGQRSWAAAGKIDTQHRTIAQPTVQCVQRIVDLVGIELNHAQQQIGPALERFQNSFRLGA